MTLLHRFARLAVLAVLWWLTLVLTLAWAWADFRLQFLGSFVDSPLLTLSAALASGSLGLLFASSGFARRHPGHFLSFEEEGGTVSISTDAIADYVAKLSTEFPSVMRMRPRVVPGRHSIDVIVDTRIKAGPQIHEVCDLLRQRVRESLTSGLGISDIGRIEISVSEIVSEHRPG